MSTAAAANTQSSTFPPAEKPAVKESTPGLTVGKTATFIKNNWQRMTIYLGAWSVVIACAGGLYGFRAVALPLTIGMGGGIVIGCAAGLKMAKDPNEIDSLWDRLNDAIEKIDPNGTRPIVLSIAVTVILSASVLFPYLMGGVIGVFIGNQAAVKAGSSRNLGPRPLTPEKEIKNLRAQIDEMTAKLNKLSANLRA
jgi:hypothetical protein